MDLEIWHRNPRWRCDICPRPIAKTFSDSSTSHATEHLHDAHSTSETGELPTNQTTIRQKPPVNIIILRKLIVEWVVDRRHSFNEIEAESFRRIIAYLDPPTINQVPRSANTISSDVIQYFKEARLMIGELLSTARSKIHLSFDLWTSPNYKAMIAITGHWTSSSYTSETALLGIREVEGAHEGENISRVIYDVAKDLGIEDKLGYFVGDNASNNNTTVRSLDKRVREDGGIGFDPEERRLRCFGHVMNIVVKGLLFGPKVSKLEKQRREDENAEAYSKRQTELWRALGVVGKLHKH